VRKKFAVPRTPMKLAAAAVVVGLAVSACGTTQLGAAAITGNSRISQSTLTSQVANLNAAYSADAVKGVKPQRPTSQENQQVLTWLIFFRLYSELASQHGITVTPAQAQAQLAALTAEAKQSGLSLGQYWSAGGALPPDLLPDLGQAAAIQAVLAAQLNGGKAPSTAKEQSAVQTLLAHQECLAAKSLGVSVNPQYGEFDYNGYQVVTAPSTLAADPTPSPAPSGVALTPPC
jgi:hypothetical protein